MTKDYSDRGAALAALLVAHVHTNAAKRSKRAPTYFEISVFVGMLRAYTKTAKTVAIARCNYDETDRVKRARDTRETRHEVELREWLKAHEISGVTVRLGGDPRGACGALIIEGMRGDGFGDGFAVY